MNLFPTSSGSRPRLACEILPEGVIAGRSPGPGLPLSAVARVDLASGGITPGLKPGNIADRVGVISALRRALENVGSRANARSGSLTLVIPDAAVRVLLLDFDSLPAKLTEALPIVRFRLKKLVPFDTEEAMVSFQVMSSSRAMVRVLAVATPRDVLREYESVVREAGFEPGAVLPSTLASLAAVEEGEGAVLVVNAHGNAVTTAIVRSGVVLLHRSVELTELIAPTPANLPPALFETGRGGLLPLVDRDATEAEWAAQEPVPEFGRNPYADRVAAEEPAQNEDGITGMTTPPRVLYNDRYNSAGAEPVSPRGIDMYAEGAAPVSRSPYASPMLQEQLDAQFHNAPFLAPSAEEALGPGTGENGLPSPSGFAGQREMPEPPEPPVHTLAPEAQSEEIARAVSVAVAFFEDTLAVAPRVLLSAGPLGADAMNRMLQEQGVTQGDGIRVRELVETTALAATASTHQVPRGWLAGVAGALKS